MMSMFKLLKKFLLILLVMVPMIGVAQDDDPKPTKKQKKAEIKKEQKVQDSRKAEIKGQKRHMKLQDKQTQKRMKKNKRKGNAYVSRRPGFFQRLFRAR